MADHRIDLSNILISCHVMCLHLRVNRSGLVLTFLVGRPDGACGPDAPCNKAPVGSKLENKSGDEDADATGLNTCRSLLEVVQTLTANI